MTGTLAATVVGAAALAAWVLARAPGFGPRALGASAGVFAGALVACAAVSPAADAVSTGMGPSGVLLMVVLPYFVVLFWASALVVRSLVDLAAR